MFRRKKVKSKKGHLLHWLTQGQWHPCSPWHQRFNYENKIWIGHRPDMPVASEQQNIRNVQNLPHNAGETVALQASKCLSKRARSLPLNHFQSVVKTIKVCLCRMNKTLSTGSMKYQKHCDRLFLLQEALKNDMIKYIKKSFLKMSRCIEHQSIPSERIHWLTKHHMDHYFHCTCCGNRKKEEK